MTAKREPCPDCDGLGHLCDEAADHIHEHDEIETCPTCDGRGSVPIESDEPEPEPEPPQSTHESDDDDDEEQ